MLALFLAISINLAHPKSSFDSLLEEYSKFKEKQMAKKASKLLGNRSSVKITQKKQQKNRRLADKKSRPTSHPPPGPERV